MDPIAFVDTEIEPDSGKLLDIGCVKVNGSQFHSNSVADFIDFLKGSQYLCGHNILQHDLKYIRDAVNDAGINSSNFIDTLFLSPLLFPCRPYHALVKDDKLQTEDTNNPLNDSLKARDLFYDEVAVFWQLDNRLKEIYFYLLNDKREFNAFFRFICYTGNEIDINETIYDEFHAQICEEAHLTEIIRKYPVELAYCLALIKTGCRYYQKLHQFYENKIQQIHIVGEYASKMITDYKAALQFVDDYFQLNYTSFLHKYFKGSRQSEIRKNITPAKFKQLFGELSPTQLKIINDKESKYIVVAAGPGSGKTRVLVHKLASLLLMEDIKHEQLLMLTFSRSSATEFKKRLLKLIGNAANFVEIKTFHSYCFDLLGKVGTLEKSADIVEETVRRIKNGEVEAGRITKTVLVIDEAQDMDEDEFSLINALIDQNEEMRVIAVGDDDQNIFEFRGSSSKYLLKLINDKNAEKEYDGTVYLTPGQIAMQLSFKDVWLDYFIYCQQLISQLKSGDELMVDGDCCLNSKGKPVLRFSKQFLNRIEYMKQRNYVPRTAVINFIIYWQRENSDNETRIILPRLYFTRQDTDIVEKENK